MFKSRTHYINHFRNLINLERDEDISRHKDEIERLSGLKREKRGRALVEMRGRRYGNLYGHRYLIKYAKAQGDALPKMEMQIGDVLLISQGHPLSKGNPIATLVEKGKYHLVVAVGQRPEKWMVKSSVRIDLYVNDVTYRRMQEALDTVMYGKEASERLLSAVIGEKDQYIPKIANVEPRGQAWMNASQMKAVSRALSAEDFHIVHGPPGTGKTRTASEVIRCAVGEGKSVLATAQSNGAVDNLAERLLESGLKCVRLGQPFKVDEKLSGIVLDHLIIQDERYKEADALREAAFAQIKDQTVYLSPSPRYSRGMRSADIHRFAKKNKGSRGVSASDMKSMSKWLKIRESIDACFMKADTLELEIAVDLLKKADVVLATNVGAGSDILEGWTFDLVLIDEATQSTESSALIPVVKGKQLVLAGDHKQLPPTVISPLAQSKGFSLSLVERLIDRYGSTAVSMLNIQYRMNDEIMRFPNQAFYDGQLESGEKNKHWRIEGLGGRLDAREKAYINEVVKLSAAFIDVNGYEKAVGEGPTYMNQEEGDCVVGLVRLLIRAGIEPSCIGVITPYKGQVNLIRESLGQEGVQVDTVDAFQGREKDVVIISFVRSGAGGLGFLNDIRRLNVALTRARKLRIAVGSAKVLSAHPVYESFIDRSSSIQRELF